MTRFCRGDVVMKSKPFAFIILTKFRKEVCEMCWDKMDAVLSCKDCHSVHYCSQECMDEGAEEHAEECTFMKNEKIDCEDLPDQLQLLLRMWIKSRNSDENLSESGYGETRCWTDLMDHGEDLLKDSGPYLEDQFALLCRVLSQEKPESTLPTRDEFVSIYGKILTNSFSLRTDRFTRPEPFGTGIYLLPSILDHSCVPNCTVVFRGREMQVVATGDIAEGPLALMANISYVNSMDDIATRQLQQKAIWYFQCDCTLCNDKSLDILKHSVLCDRCSQPCPINPQYWGRTVNCVNCNRSIPSDRISRYKSLYELVESGAAGQEGMSYNELCEWVVGEMEDLFTERDIVYVKTLHYVHTVCIQMERWSAGITYGERVLPMFELYYGGRTGVVAGLLLRLGICHGEEGNTEMSSLYFERADDIYRVIPGEKHPFYTDDFLKIYNTYVCEP